MIWSPCSLAKRHDCFVVDLVLGLFFLEYRTAATDSSDLGMYSSEACHKFSPTAEKILNFPFWVGKMLLGLNVLGFMAHPGLHSGSRLSYITLYHLCSFFRNPEFSNAFAVWDWNMLTNHKCSTFLLNRFMFLPTGSLDEEDCLTMRSIWFSLSKLQWLTFYTRLIYTLQT